MKYVRDDCMVFERSGANASVTSGAQDTPAFSRYRSRIGQVVINLRHKHEIDAAVRERKLVCGRPPKYDRARRRFPPGLVDHFLGWIQPEDPRTEFRRQHVGKAPGATATVHDPRVSGA